MDLATKAEERPLPDLVRLYIFFKLRPSLSKLYFFPRVSCVSFLRRAICQTPCSIRHRGAEPSSMHCFRVHVSIANQPTGPVLLLTVPCSPPLPSPPSPITSSSFLQFIYHCAYSLRAWTAFRLHRGVPAVHRERAARMCRLLQWEETWSLGG